MTFTNKAATEMKDRILQKLIQLSKTADKCSSEDLSARKEVATVLGIKEDVIQKRSASSLNQILHNYGMFSVMTIDKFTHKVIRTFARDLGLTLDFDVELDIGTLRKNVTDLLFDQIGRNQELTNLMVHYADSNLKDDKSWNFKDQLFKFSDALFKEDAIGAIEKLKKFQAKDFIEIRKNLIEEQREFEKKLIKIGKDAMEVINFHSLEGNDFAGKNRSGIISLFKKNESGEVKLPTDTQIKNVAAGNWGHKDSPNKDTVDSIAGDLENFYNQIIVLQEEELPQYILNKEILKNLNNLSLMNHILKMTEDIKQEENILLISDFYKMISEIIIEEPVPFIYERLGVRYEHFLLDEFQDTSHLQWVNIIPLLHNSLAQQKTNLIVGDGKQAIYRWRNGEVEQFADLPNKIYNPENISSLKEAETTFAYEGVKISLKDNWRSAPEIVHFNNAFFDEMSKDSEYIGKIYLDGSQTPKKTHKGYLEFNLQENLEDDDQNAYALSVIQQALEKKYELKDICILTSKNKQGAKVAKFLTENGIKVISQDSLFVGKDIHVKFVFSIIAALSSPLNLNYRMKCIEHYIQLFPIQNEQELWKEATETSKPLDKILSDWAANVDLPENFHSFYEYVEHVIASFKLNVGQNPYLQYFLEQIHQFEKQSSTNIQAFIQWFNDKGRMASISSPEGAQAVQVMTIHKAKGLEFPIVICPFFDWDMKKMPSNKWIEDDESSIPAYFLTATKQTKQTKHKLLMEEEEVKAKMDHLNMIYVAFTRPEIALYVSGNSKKTSSPAKDWLSPYLSTHQGVDGIKLENDIYTIGTLEPKATNSSTISSAYHFNFLEHYADRSAFSLKGELDDVQEGIDAKRKYGTELHLLLSVLNEYSDLEVALAKLSKKGKLGVENINSLRKDVQRLFNDTHFSSYFIGDNIFNERIIIGDDGKTYIPDKIVQTTNEVLVVDYKTGEENSEKYKKQLHHYLSLLSEMGMKNLRGEIFYTTTLEFIEVQFE